MGHSGGKLRQCLCACEPTLQPRFFKHNQQVVLFAVVFKHSFPAVSDRPSFLNSAAAMCLNVLDAAYLAAVNRTFLMVFFEYGFLHASSGILALICPI